MSRPDPRDVEVSVFGPGFGECVLVHLGGGDWMVVDSCVAPDGQPAALSYLKSIGVDPSCVRVILASHFHKDHIAGMERLVSTCSTARFYCSAALSFPDAQALIALYGGDPPRVAGAREFSRVLKVLDDAGRAPNWVNANQAIFRRSPTSDAPACSVTSLSPSPEAVDHAVRVMASKIPTNGEPRRPLVWREPNVNAIALWVRVGALSILLGGDLEESSDAFGWTAVVKSPVREPGRAHVFKIPHHGSQDAHADGVWDEMLVPGPVGVMSSFHNGSHHLPTPAMCRRIRALTSDAYSTQPGDWRPPKAHGLPTAVERTARDAGIQLRERFGKVGHVRARCRTLAGAERSWEVALQHGASRL